MDNSLAALAYLRHLIELARKAGPPDYRHNPALGAAIDACLALVAEREDRLMVAMSNAMNAQIESMTSKPRPMPSAYSKMDALNVLDLVRRGGLWTQCGRRPFAIHLGISERRVRAAFADSAVKMARGK